MPDLLTFIFYHSVPFRLLFRPELCPRFLCHFALKGLRFFNFLSDLRSVMPDNFYLKWIKRAVREPTLEDVYMLSVGPQEEGEFDYSQFRNMMRRR